MVTTRYSVYYYERYINFAYPLEGWGRRLWMSSEWHLPMMQHSGSLTTIRWTHSAALPPICSSVGIAESWAATPNLTERRSADASPDWSVPAVIAIAKGLRTTGDSSWSIPKLSCWTTRLVPGFERSA